jgi:hypothetical protein
MTATATITTGPRSFLLGALRLDAAASCATGILLAVGAPWLDGALSAPLALLVALGLFLVAYAGFLLLLVRRGGRSGDAKLVIAGNVAWIAASIAVVVGDWLTLSTFGVAFTLVQAAAVAVFVELQLIGLRRAAKMSM